MELEQEEMMYLNVGLRSQLGRFCGGGYWNMLRNFKIKKHTKYEIISFISLMISYAVGTFFSKYERFDILGFLGSFGLLAISIVTYMLSIKNNPNKNKIFHSRKGKILFVLGCFIAIILLMILMYEHKWFSNIKLRKIWWREKGIIF